MTVIATTLIATERRDVTTRLGRHFVVEFKGCDPERLKYADDLREVMVRAAEKASATVVGFAFHQFRPFGASGVLLLAESHLAMHSWPEKCYLAMDIFTCGDELDPDIAIEVVKAGVDAEEVCLEQLDRGI